MSGRYIKVDTTEVRLGMFVSDLDRPWLDTPFLIQGFLLEEEEDLATLQSLCRYILVDPLRSTVELTPNQLSLAPPGIELGVYVDQAPLEQELPRATEAFTRTQEVLEELVHDIHTGGHLHIDQVDEAAHDMVDSVVSNPDALMWVTRLRGQDSMTYAHGIRVSVYLLALGRHLGFPVSELHHLGMIGLLLDLGKTKLPRALLEKRDKLTAAEFELVKRHVEYSIEMLSSSATIHPIILEGIAQHHERLNGRGYPKGLSGDGIGIYGRMAGIADCFAALTSPRPYTEAISPNDALSNLYESSGEYFHAPLIERLVHAIGVFPVGSLVELSTDEVGIVIRHNRVRRLLPTVLVVTGADKTPLDRPLEIDLLNQQSRGSNAPIRILRGLPADAFGLDTSAYYIGPAPMEKPGSPQHG